MADLPNYFTDEDGDPRKYGWWTVVDDAGLSKWGGRLLRVRCKCGNVRIVLANNLRMGRSTSCGVCKSQMKRKWRWHPEHDAYFGKKRKEIDAARAAERARQAQSG